MKEAFFLLFLIPTIALSQSEFKFTLIDSIKETKAELFIKATKALISCNATIEVQDKEAGVIIGKGVMVYDEQQDKYAVVHYIVNYTLTVSVKTNKYRLVLSDFINDGYLKILKLNETVGKDSTYRIGGWGLKLDDDKFLALPYSKDVIIEVTKRANDIIETFKAAMQAKKDDF